MRQGAGCQVAGVTSNCCVNCGCSGVEVKRGNTVGSGGFHNDMITFEK